MDCRTALTLLDSARPDSDDLAMPDLAAAAEHLAHCAGCEATFVKRQSVDRKLGLVMRDVPIPAGLEDRILRAIERRSAPSLESIPAPAETKPKSRAAWSARLRFIVAASILLLLGVGTWGIVVLTSPALTLQDMLQELAETESWDLLPDFHGDSELASFPDSSWQNGWIAPRGPLRGLPRQAGTHLASVRPFAASVDRHHRVSGMLMVLFRRSIASPPEESAGMPNGPIDYVTAGGEQFTFVTWSSGEFVYVCGIEGGADELERFQRSLQLPPA